MNQSFFPDKSQWMPRNGQLSPWWIPSFHVISWLGSDLSLVRRQLYTAVDRGERYKMKRNMSLKYFPCRQWIKLRRRKNSWVPNPVNIKRFHSISVGSQLGYSAERSCTALRVPWAAVGRTTFPDITYIACWHLAWIMHSAFSRLLSSLLLILQSETKISGSKNYILMLSIAYTLTSFRAKIKSCCDFKCRPPLWLNRRHCVIINLNHCWTQSMTHYNPLPVWCECYGFVLIPVKWCYY